MGFAEEYLAKRRSKALLTLTLLSLCVVFMSIGCTVGAYDVSVLDVYRIIVDGLLGNGDGGNAYLVVWNIRIPRILFGLAAGFGLGICGAVMQSMLNNPLASPYTLGISSGAGFGAALAILAGIYVVGGDYLIVVNAFVFAMVSAISIYAISSVKRASPETMILAGIALSYLFSSMTIILEFFSTPEAVYDLIFWTAGSLSKATWGNLSIVLLVELLFIPLIVLKANDLNVMMTGDDSAHSLGINVRNTRLLLLGLISMITSTIVCFTGLIGFIGLVSPHIVRMIIGDDNSFVIPASGLMGALLLAISDLVSITVIRPVALPVGAITALIGVPFFLYLILRRKREVW